MLKILFNMKALPTVECVKLLGVYYNNNINNQLEIFNALLRNGLPVNLEIIEAAFLKGLYIPNLEDYGFKPDLELYKICYKYKNFPNVYVSQLEKNPSVDIDIRLTIADKASTNKQKTEEEIIDMIKLRNIVPDYMMYGQAVCNNKIKLIDYFENEWNMKPNLDTLVLIDVLKSRHEYLERIIKCHNIQQSAITTVAVPKQVEIVAVPKQVEIVAKVESTVEEIKEDKEQSKTKSKKIIVRSRQNPKTRSVPRRITKEKVKAEHIEYNDE